MEAKMIQESAPLPGRDAELEFVVRALGLQEQIVNIPQQ
jgi:hypothetical protein